MKIKKFESIKIINESSYTDFLMHYGDEIRVAIQRLDKIGQESAGEEDFFNYDEIDQRLENYDKNVIDEIDDWVVRGVAPEEIAEFAIRNQDRYGTEPRMVLYAIEDYFHACGLYDEDEEEDEEEIEENFNVKCFEEFKDKVTFEMSDSPKPYWVTKAEFVADMQDWGYSHTTLNKNTDMLIVSTKNLNTLKCQKAEKYGIPIYTYKDAFDRKDRLYKRVIRNKKLDNLKKKQEED